jgi:hypothetical protein
VKTFLLLALVGPAISFALPTFAQEQSAVDPEAREEIEAVAMQFVEAYNKHDAAATAALYTQDGALAVVSWPDAMDYWHFGLGRLTDNILYRFDQESADAMRGKILAAMLKTHNLTLASCASSALTPDRWENAENVVIGGQAAGQNEELASYQLNGWTVLYNVRKQEVAKVLQGGKLEAVRNVAAQANGRDKIQNNELPEVGSWVSPDGVLRLVGRHLGTSNWLDLIGTKKSGQHFPDSINADSPVFKDAFAFHGLSQDHDLGDHYGTSFEGWSGKANQFIVGFHCRLGSRGPHGSFYEFSGWTGVYDPDKNQVVQQLTPGSICEPICGY